MQELTDHQEVALALQFCELDPSHNLSASERRDVAEVVKLIQLYQVRTDIAQGHTLEEQGAMFEVHPQTIKRWVKGDLYQRICLFMAPPRINPIVEAAEEYIRSDLLPLALREAAALLADPGTSSGAKVALIKEIVRVGTRGADDESADAQRRSAMDFLREQNVNVETLNVLVETHSLAPPDYQATLNDVVDVDYAEVD